MPIVNKHSYNSTKKIYVGGWIKPLTQILTASGPVLVENSLKPIAKKILAGVASTALASVLAHLLTKGREYFNRTGLNSTIYNGPVQPIDREILPIQNQLLADTADINVTSSPIKEVMKTIERPYTGYGNMPKNKKMNKVISNALSKRSNLLLRNVLDN